MKDRKVAARHTYRGFGFPVVLMGVPMVRVRGRWTPDVNLDELQSMLLEVVAERDGRLTGDEVRFIRLAHHMTLAAFAERFGVTHPAVLKWERAGARPSGMSWSTEKDMRLFVLAGRPSAEKRFLEAYRALEKKPTAARTALSLSVG